MIDISPLIRSTQPIHLLAYYPLDGNADDKSGSGHDGADTAVTWRPGGAQNNGYADLNTPGTSEIDFGASFRGAFNSAGAGNAGTVIVAMAMDWTSPDNVVFQIKADNSNQILFRKRPTAGQIWLQYQAGGTYKSVIVNGLTGSDFVWFALTWDSVADEVKGYVSGAQYGPTRTGLGTWAGSLTVSRFTNALFDIQTDECAIWSVALTADEIEAIYDAATATVPGTGLSDYKIRLFNTAGALQYEVTDFQALNYDLVVNGVGSAQFEVSGEHALVTDIADMWQVEIWRRNQALGIDWMREFSGFFRQSERIDVKPGVFVGVCLSDVYLLARRIVAWSAGTADRSKFSAVAAETILKTLVDYNATANATTANGRERDGEITGVTVESGSGGGNTLDWYCAWKNLLTALQEIAEVAGGDFDLVKTGAAAWEFRWYLGQLGMDRSATITFSIGYDNMSQPHFRDERLQEKTVAIVGGQGSGGSRDIEIRTGTNYSAANDIELFVDARDVDASDTAALQDRGDQRLSDIEAIDLFSFDAQQTAAVAYGRDYFLGYIVSVLSPFSGSTESHQITTVRVTVNTNGEQVKIGLGGAILSAEEIVVSEINNLKSRLQAQETQE